MANPQTAIADAFEKLKRSISEEDAHRFASTELQDVWLAVREIDSRQRERRSAQNLRRIEPLLRGIGKYTKVIEVLCNGTPYMPYVWAPIKLMLEIACHHRDVFEALISAYADIGAALPRFDRYKEAFADNVEFQHALAAVYTSILDFHQRAYKFFRRRAWHVIFLSLWKDFGSRFDSIIDSLKKQRDFVDVEAASFDIIEGKESRTRIQDEIRRRQKQDLEILEENEKNAKISQLQHSLAWLSVDEKTQETEYERTSERRHDRTCEWVAEAPQLKNWVKNDVKRPCLWLDGKPGSGKSVMCSYIIQTLTNTPGLTVCYYFCNSKDIGNVCQQILTTIVLQILRQHPDICTLIANEFVYRGVSCGMAQLKILVPQLLEIIAYTRIIIDGIDECSKENQKAILKDLEVVCIGPTTCCKILFSSRREAQIYKKLSEQPQISLDGRQEVDWDIRSFVKYKITKLSTSDQDLLDKIESILVEKANGMFLWVRLVVDELKYCYSDAALEETAKSLPKGLEAAYGRILDRIMDPRNSRTARYMAIRILGWMACSYRILKSYELLDGIAFDASNTTLSPKTKIRKEIFDLCRPLIEEGPAGTVDFVHFSAKQYILEEEYQADRPFIWRENAHLDISFSCVAFLNSCVSLLPENSTAAQRADIIIRGFHGLQIYADMFWYKHLLAYCGLLGQHKRQFSPELHSQLQHLLIFRKEDSQAPVLSRTASKEKNGPEDPILEALNHLPDVQRLVSDVLVFRAKMNREDASDKSPEKLSLDSCDMDPTHFSAIRHHYQQTAESLLDNKAQTIFPGINKKDLQAFRDTYGASAYVCRYLHCVFSNDGFDSSSQRAKHESQHQRRFRCAHCTCAYFTAGFPTRNHLNKHNEKFHPVIAKGPTLADIMTQPAVLGGQINAVQSGGGQQPQGQWNGQQSTLTSSHGQMQQRRMRAQLMAAQDQEKKRKRPVKTQEQYFQMMAEKQREGSLNEHSQMQQQPVHAQEAGQMDPNEQRTVAQMDTFNVPPAFKIHPSMPQGVPLELKKWGQLKQWVVQNPSLGPDTLEAMKALQRLHYQQISRNLAQTQPGAVVPASGAPRNETPQPGFMSGQPMNMNDQRGVANPDPRVQQQKQQSQVHRPVNLLEELQEQQQAQVQQQLRQRILISQQSAMQQQAYARGQAGNSTQSQSNQFSPQQIQNMQGPVGQLFPGISAQGRPRSVNSPSPKDQAMSGTPSVKNVGTPQLEAMQDDESDIISGPISDERLPSTYDIANQESDSAVFNLLFLKENLLRLMRITEETTVEEIRECLLRQYGADINLQMCRLAKFEALRLQDYQMQLMLLEQQNKKRLMMARQEDEAMGVQD